MEINKYQVRKQLLLLISYAQALQIRQVQLIEESDMLASYKQGERDSNRETWNKLNAAHKKLWEMLIEGDDNV